MKKILCQSYSQPVHFDWLNATLNGVLTVKFMTSI